MHVSRIESVPVQPPAAAQLEQAKAVLRAEVNSLRDRIRAKSREAEALQERVKDLNREVCTMWQDFRAMCQFLRIQTDSTGQLVDSGAFDGPDRQLPLPF